MIKRPRRLRRTAAIRDLVAETHVSAHNLVQPHFVLPQDDEVRPIDAMPGIDRMGQDALVRRAESDLELGIRPPWIYH